MDNFGFFISPDGSTVDVHETPPYTHYGHASWRASADSRDPIGDLLKAGWIRVSLDVIQVHGLDEAKKAAISRFVKSHPEFYKDDLRVGIDDEEDETSVLVGWQELLG